MELTALLHERGLKVTPTRLGVLEELSTTGLALSQSELEATFNKVDRITLYRVLRDLEETGIVHRIAGTDGVVRFAFCHNDCPDEAHTDDHVHFNCMKCQRMYCLEHTHSPKIKLPTGFESVETNIVISGICATCS